MNKQAASISVKHISPPLSRVKDGRGSAEAYLRRHPRKHQQEMAMIEDAFNQLENIRHVLDAPCGVGRATAWLCQQGYNTTGVDLGNAAVELTREQLIAAKMQATIEKQDVFNMHFADRAFDATLCFRLLHHFQEIELRKKLIAELCRVTGNYVVISYISGWSYTSLRRKLRCLLSGKAIKQYPSTLSELKHFFDASDFVFHYQVSRSTIMHSLQLAVFKRKSVP